jgi:hypothetical protein
MTTAAQPRGLRISLRELLLLFTALFTACAALRYANVYWLVIVTLITLVGFIATAVIALIDRGPRQALAIGFVMAVGIYMTLIFCMRVTGYTSAGSVRTDNAELDPEEGSFPTTLALRPLFVSIQERWYIDPSGTPIPRSQLPPAVIASPNNGGGYVYDQERPNRQHFMLIGHCLWALLFGYAAAKFARWVYGRRLRESPSLAPGPTP